LIVRSVRSERPRARAKRRAGSGYEREIRGIDRDPSCRCPIAMPGSACGAGGGGQSLTPVATKRRLGHFAAGGRNDPRLWPGARPRRPRSVPNRPPRRGGRLVVAGQQQGQEGESAQTPHGIRRARRDLVGDGEQRAAVASQPPTIAVRHSASSLGDTRLRSSSGRHGARRRAFGEQRGRPATDRWPVGDAAYARAMLDGRTTSRPRGGPAGRGRRAARSRARSVID